LNRVRVFVVLLFIVSGAVPSFAGDIPIKGEVAPSECKGGLESLSISYPEGIDKTSPQPIVPTGSQVYYPSGTYYFSETDLRIPARSIPMVWERTYRSNRVVKKDSKWVFGEPADGPLGFGWSTPFSVRIEGGAYVNEEGRYFSFEKDTNGNYLPNMEAGFILLKTASGYELIERGGNTRVFDANGRLASIKDPRGNTVTLNYDTGKLTSIKDVINRQIFTFTYNAGGRISSVTDIAGRTLSYEYDSVGNLIKVSHGTEVISTYTYNNNHGLTSKSNALGETYTIEYYPTWVDKGVAKKIIDPTGTELMKAGGQSTGHETVFTYDFQNRVFYYTDLRGVTYKNVTNEKGQIVSTEEVQNGQAVLVSKTEYLANRIAKTTDALGNVTTIQKDEWGNVTKKTDAGGYEWKYSYNTLGKLLTMTDPLGTITRYEYDAYGNRTKETVAAGTTDESVTTYTYTSYNERETTTQGDAATRYTYDSGGNITGITDPMGNVTSVTYDTAGNILTKTQPLIGATTYSDYDYRGNPGSMTDSNGGVTIYTYDVLGRVKTAVSQLDNAKTEHFYVTTGLCSSCSGGGTGKISKIVLPEGNKTEYEYDNAGSLTRIIDNDGNSINYSYDTKGNRTKEEIKDTAGVVQKTVSYQYDLLNRILKVINPDGGYTLYGYDTRGNKASVKDPNGNETTYFYDSLNRLSKTIQPGNIVTGYSYDRRNNLLSVTDANGNPTTYEYDKQNRQTKTISPDTGTTVYAYDLNGNIKTKKDALEVTITYNYDAANRLVMIDFPTDTDTLYTYDACFNGKGRLCTMTDASGITSYEYFLKGQVTKEMKVIDGVTYVTEYGYDKNGNTKTMKYPSGRVITYQLLGDKVQGVLNNGIAIASNITYKPFGSMAGITYGNGLAGSISYDLQYRISGIKANGIQDLSYGYDPSGNIVGITNNLDPAYNKTYTYDSLSRLTGATGSWGTLSYTYDGVGNRQKETKNAVETNYTYTANKLTGSSGEKAFAFGYDNNGNTATGNARQYIYNQNQRLIKVTEGGSTKGEYSYNGNGQRVKKTTGAGGTVFHYDRQGKMMAETAPTGTPAAEYVFLNDNPLARIEGGSVYYYHNDHLGTPLKITDSSGSVVWQGEFMPFGEPISVAGAIINNLRFPGQYNDVETGLNYNYFRDYNPLVGRYVEVDPIGLKGGINLYIYATNSPIIYKDVNGLDVKLCHRQMEGAFLLPHCYICVDKRSFSWHPRGMFGDGITVADESCGGEYCRKVKCCPQNQAAFEQCVSASAGAEIGGEGGWWIPTLHDCCTWSHRIVGECYKKYCKCCK